MVLHFLLDNRMMSQSSLNIKPVKIIEQRKPDLKLEMVALNNIKN